MNWQPLTDLAQLEQINHQSHTEPVVIFKHSTRCSISVMAKNRMERTYTPSNVVFYHLDLLAHRDISNRIAAVYHVHHESPQVLLIHNGKCVYHESHNGINIDDILAHVND